MRFAIGAAVVVVAVTIGGCGGGGSSNIRPEPPDRPGPPPTKECPDGSVVPADQACPVVPPSQGTGPLPGIERIPRSAIKASNQQLAGQWTILEYVSDHETPGSHAQRVRRVACESFITGCESGRPAPVTVVDNSDIYADGRGGQPSHVYPNIIPSGMKLVSGSFSPGWDSLQELDRQQTSFALIQSAGNNPDSQGVGDGGEAHLRTFAADPEIAQAIQDNRVLFVAGYTTDESGNFITDPWSVSCEGAENQCIYAPYRFVLEDGSLLTGTSAATPQVAAGLASVLALFPDTTRYNLIKLGKTCAVSEPGLPGLGRADFTCMTVMEDGRWRVVGVDEVINPGQMQSMRFPGRASVSGQFAHPNAPGETVALGLTSLGIFRFTPGVPVVTEESVTGLFPVMVGDEQNHTLGVGYATSGGWFSRLSYGQRDTFFGLEETYGYAGSTAIDADAGHRSLFARVSWQSARESRLIHGAEGIAFGIGAQRDVYRAGEFGVNLSGSMSRFLGGSADTAFGKVLIGESRWNREVAATARYAPNDGSTVEVATEYRRFGPADEVGVTVNYKLTF